VRKETRAFSRIAFTTMATLRACAHGYFVAERGHQRSPLRRLVSFLWTH
jgi:hypothetical protein